MKTAVTKFETGPFWVNTWVITNESQNAVIVDPGGITDELMQYLKEHSISHIDIMLTHGHFDHVGGIPALIEVYPDYRLLIHQADAAYVGAAAKEQHLKSFTPIRAQRVVEALEGSLPEPSVFLCEGDTVNGLYIIHTPGHTNGSVCLWQKEEGFLFSGDTLFCRSRGRTDLLDGNETLIHQSIKKLFDIVPAETTVYPGHGSNTTIGEEKQFQPH